MNSWFLLLLPLFHFLPSRIVSQRQENFLDEAGLLAVHTRSIWIRKGDHHAILDTNLDIESDIGLIHSLTLNFSKQCEFSKGEFCQSLCTQGIEEVKQFTKSSKDFIEALRPFSNHFSTTKSKRSGGLLGGIQLLIKFLIGDNEPEHDSIAFRSAEATKHALEDFRVFEEALSKRQEFLSQKINVKANELRKELDRSYFDLELSIKIIALKEATISQITDIVSRYEKNNYKTLLRKELLSLNSIIKTKYSDLAILPHISEKQLIDLINVSVMISVSFWATIPLVDPSPFQEFFIIPSPDPKSLKIPKFSPQLILVNLQHNESISHNINIAAINETVGITSQPILAHNRISENAPCFLRSLVEGRNLCILMDIEPSTDSWFQTPIPNMVGYVSVVEKNFSCPLMPEKSRIINDIAGFTKIREGCVITTNNHVIFGSLESSSHTFKIYKIKHIQIDNPAPNRTRLQTTTSSFIEKMPETPALDTISSDIVNLEAL
jgi:hypothetical protein